MAETVLKDLDRSAEGNKLNSLNLKEKQDLQNLSVESIQKQKVALGNESFNVGGKNMKLSEIVKNFDTATGTVNGVKVEKRSDLAAAIQVFVLANGKHISVNPIAANNEAKGIDGIVGTNTKSGIDAYKNGIKSEIDRTKEDGNDKIDNTTIKGLPTYPFAKVFDKLRPGLAAKYKKMGFLDSDGGCLAKWKYRINKNGTEAVIYYISEVDGKSHAINFNIKKDAYGEVIVKQFANDIISKIDASEKTLKIEGNNDSVAEGLDAFKNSEITDPLIRKWAELKKINFEAKTYTNGRIVIKDKYGKKLCGGLQSGGFMLNNTDLLVNGMFDKKKFNAIISKKCHAEAVKAVKEDVMRTANGLKRPSSITNSVNTYPGACDDLLKEIKGFGSGKDFDEEIKKINALKVSYEKQHKYLQSKQRVDEKVSDIKKLGNTSENFLKNFDTIYAKMRSIVAISKDPNVKYKYTIDYRTKVKKDYVAVGKGSEYINSIDTVVNLWKNIREGGDAKYTLDIKK